MKTTLPVSLFLIVSAVLLTAWSNTLMTPPDPELPKLTAPRILVKKSDRVLELYDGEKLVKTYKTALGFSPIGDKEIEGDGKTPEGDFYVFAKNPKSKFFLSVGISYPNIEDAKRGSAAGLINRAEYEGIIDAIGSRKTPPQKTKLGGEIYVHGGGTASDWTEGCIAMENEDIKELFEAIPVGAPVSILP